MPTRWSHRDGFTLLELVLVLLIIGTTLAVAAPRLRDSVAWWRTKDTARDVVEMTQYAWSSAVANSTTYRLNIEPDGRTYWLSMLNGENYVRLGTGIAENQAVEGTRIELSRAVDGGRDYVEFYPNGRKQPATIRITNARGDMIVLVCPSAAERFEIVPTVEGMK